MDRIIESAWKDIDNADLVGAESIIGCARRISPTLVTHDAAMITHGVESNGDELFQRED